MDFFYIYDDNYSYGLEHLGSSSIWILKLSILNYEYFYDTVFKNRSTITIKYKHILLNGIFHLVLFHYYIFTTFSISFYSN